jgi:hypothetical protein
MLHMHMHMHMHMQVRMHMQYAVYNNACNLPRGHLAQVVPDALPSYHPYSSPGVTSPRLSPVARVFCSTAREAPMMR